MPRSHNDEAPAKYVAEGLWPWCRLRHDAPPSAYFGMLVARTMYTAMTAANISNRSLGRAAGVAHNTVARILKGEVLPDIDTFSRLEYSLNQSLWAGPDEIQSCINEHSN